MRHEINPSLKGKENYVLAASANPTTTTKAPDTRPVPEITPTPQRKRKEPLTIKQKVAMGAAAFAVAVAGVGVATVVAHKFSNRTEQTETISGIPLDRNSFTPISKEEEQELWSNTKTVDLENHTFTLGFPFDQATINISNLLISQEFNAILPPPEKAQYEKDGVKNVTTMSGLPNGTEYKLKHDYTKYEASVILLGTAGVTEGKGLNSFTPAYTSYRIILRNIKTGEIEQGRVSGLYAEPLIKTNPYPTDHHATYEDGTPVKFDSQLMRLTTDLQDWDGKTGQIVPGEKGQFQLGFSSEQQSPYDSRTVSVVLLTAQFLKAPDGNIVPADSTK